MAVKKLTDLVVTAAMVAARRADDSIVYLYRGTPLPSGLAEGEAKRLADLGMVGEHAVPLVAEPPRPTARVHGRGRAPAAPASAAPAVKKTPAKQSSGKAAAEKAAAEKAAEEAAAANADGGADVNGDGTGDGAGDPGDDNSKD